MVVDLVTFVGWSGANSPELQACPPVPGGRAVQPHPPRIRGTLGSATVNEHDLEPDTSFEALVFADLDLAGRRAVAVEFEEYQFRAARFASSQLDRLRLTD
ncbi:hypothetical protein ABZS66_12225 [Dactylosporangium sp. NPDC005572]|uniref:hypothetical protein n=1 Tax=Dactylosporangium sp. NPDC005572 TaxID=3156889 RepID=UPI0033A61792